MGEKLKKRSEVAENLKWDLSRLFKNEAAYQQTLKEIESEAKMLSKKYRGTIRNASVVLSVLKEYSELKVKMTQVFSYANLALSVDMTDEENQRRFSYVERISSEIETEIKFIENELMELEETIIDEAIMQTEEFKVYLGILKERKKHHLMP